VGIHKNSLRRRHIPLWDLTKATKNRVCAVNENILAVHKPTPERAIQW
jgi:hypothetical protein